MLTIIPSLFMIKPFRGAAREARALEVGGDFKISGFQTGGTLVIMPGGDSTSQTTLVFKQQTPADHVEVEQVLTALDIQVEELIAYEEELERQREAEEKARERQAIADAAAAAAARIAEAEAAES